MGNSDSTKVDPGRPTKSEERHHLLDPQDPQNARGEVDKKGGTPSHLPGDQRGGRNH